MRPHSHRADLAATIASVVVVLASCGRPPGPSSRTEEHGRDGGPNDASDAVAAGKHDADVLWMLATPEPNGSAQVAVAADGTIGIVVSGALRDADASRFLGHGVSAGYPGTGVALFVLANENGVVWERRAQTEGYAYGLVVAGSRLVAGTFGDSVYEQTGVARPLRDSNETAVAIAARPEDDILYAFDSPDPLAGGSRVIGAAGDRILTLSAGLSAKRVTAWRKEKPDWFVDPKDAPIFSGAVVDDAVALCLSARGKELVLSGRPAIPLAGYEHSHGVVVWLSAAGGKVVRAQPLLGKIDDPHSVHCPYFTAVRRGAVLGEVHEDRKEIDVKLVPVDGSAPEILATVHHDLESFFIGTDGGDQIVIVDSNLVAGGRNPYPVTLTVIDTARKKVRWTGVLPDGVGGFSAIALRGNLLVYASSRTGPMEVNGRLLPAPPSTTRPGTAEGGIVIAYRLPPMP